MDQPSFDADTHAARWAELARSIAAIGGQVRENPAPAVTAGELIIIGSGIETVGFSIGDEALIRSADHVFYCVADPATVVWLRDIRPDAMDLYVLYDDHKVRYTTYMQMAEAQLYWVRQGKKVVVVFYGHPGIFVLSTHRAVRVARREGHRAIMKAGVSALDCLCADLGVDPCQPGLQTHEATDLLIRDMVPDTRLHVVLWQVGLIGELGFRRQGFLNSNFSKFVSYLQRFYGPDYPVTHYIASRYPTIPPVIEVHPLSRLLDPKVQTSITGLSTFYLPPKDVCPVNNDMAHELGMLSPGQMAAKPTQPLRDIMRYGPRERAAFRDFAHFQVPAGYQWQAATEASRFLVALRQDPKLQELYARDPAAALADPRFVGLSADEHRLLMSRDTGAIQLAAKGFAEKSSPNHKLLVRLLTDKRACLSLLARVRDTTRRQARDAVSRWSAAEGTPVAWQRVSGDLMAVQRNCLFPWTGVYGDAASSTIPPITLVGDRKSPKAGAVYWGDRQIQGAVFERGSLRWSAAAGNPHNAFLRFDVTPAGTRRLLGKVWGPGAPVPETNTLDAPEVDPQRHSLQARALLGERLTQVSALNGAYRLRLADGRRLDLALTDGRGSLSVQGGTSAPLTVTLDNGTLTWADGPTGLTQGSLRVLADPMTLCPELFGTAGTGQDQQPCFGSGLFEMPSQDVAALPEDLLPHDWAAVLASVSRANRADGGLFLWFNWEKTAFTSLVVNRTLSELL